MTDHNTLRKQIDALEAAFENLPDRDKTFARSLIEQYSHKGLSEKQCYWVGKLLENAGVPAVESAESSTEEVFNGNAIRDLLLYAAQKLLHPKLRYQSNSSSKVVFSLGGSGTKWEGCVFIDNGGRENKKRYGFISKFGNGKLDRSSPPEIKKLIRTVAENPSVEAKLQGQKYSSCCFCGLGLVNKSSVHHGYGPICAGNYGLPWGDTGDAEDEEKAAAEEMKHIQLTDL